MNARRQAPTLCHVVFLIGKLPLGPLSVLCPPPVVSLLGSVRLCQNFSFPVAAHASAECHFSPEALAAVGKDGDSSLRLIS